MKLYSLLFLMLLSTAHAQTDTGNGGNVFWCEGRPAGQRAILIDSQEAMNDAIIYPEMMQVPLKGATISEKVQSFQDRLARLDPVRAAEYRAVATQLMMDMDPATPSGNRVLAFPKPDGHNLYLTRDFNIRTVPEGCEPRAFINQLTKPVKNKPFMMFDPVIINELSKDDLVKALYHEAIYMESKASDLADGIPLAQINSDAVRRFVGRVASVGFETMNECDYFKLMTTKEIGFLKSFQIFGKYRIPTEYLLRDFVQNKYFEYKNKLSCDQQNITARYADIAFENSKKQKLTYDLTNVQFNKMNQLTTSNYSVESRDYSETYNQPNICYTASEGNTYGDSDTCFPAKGTFQESNSGLFQINWSTNNGSRKSRIFRRDLTTVWESGVVNGALALPNRTMSLSEITAVESIFRCSRNHIQHFRGEQEYLSNQLQILKAVRTAIVMNDVDGLNDILKKCESDRNTLSAGSVRRYQKLNVNSDSFQLSEKNKVFITEQMKNANLTLQTFDDNLLSIAKLFASHHGKCEIRYNAEVGIGAFFVSPKLGTKKLDCTLFDGRRAIYAGPSLGLYLGIGAGAYVSLELKNPDKPVSFYVRFSGRERNRLFTLTQDITDRGVWIEGADDDQFMLGFTGKHQSNKRYGLGLHAGMDMIGVHSPIFRTKNLGDDFMPMWKLLLSSAADSTK